MKKIELIFYPTAPSEKNTGLKHVLFEIITNESEIIHDWGFAEWLGDKWGEVPTPEGFACKVVFWANTVDPDLLLKEKSKIIQL